MARVRGDPSLDQWGEGLILEVADVATPIGAVRIAARGRRLCALGFLGQWEDVERTLRRRYPGLELRTGEDCEDLAAPLRAYFRGEVRALEALPVELGGTPFQERVWAALRTIPCGTTISYRDLADRVGAPRASRAVGSANGANPVPVVIPCHRVIGTDGSLVGYGGGLRRKRWLLEHEAGSAGARHGLPGCSSEGAGERSRGRSSSSPSRLVD